MSRLLAVLGLIGSTTLPALAQDYLPPVAEPPIYWTTYRPLTTWDSIKLGAAYFTDPALIRATEIAYQYNPSIFVAEGHAHTLIDLAKKKQILCAIGDFNMASKETIKAVPCQKVLDFPDSTGTFSIISTQPSLLDKKPTTVLVSQNVPETTPRSELGYFPSGAIPAPRIR